MKLSKKRFVVLGLAMILLISLVGPSVLSQENETNNTPSVKKKFKGSVTIKSGSPLDYNFKIVSGMPFYEFERGESREIKLFVRKNPEGEPLHDVNIEITNNAFEALVKNPKIKELKNEEMAVIYVVIIIPNDIEYGDYQLKTLVESREFSATDYKPLPAITIRVKKKSHIKNIALYVGIISVFALLFWRKYNTNRK